MVLRCKKMSVPDKVNEENALKLLSALDRKYCHYSAGSCDLC